MNDNQNSRTIHLRPTHALHRTRHGVAVCNPRVPRAVSLSLGHWRLAARPVKIQLFILCAVSFLFASSEVRGAEPSPAKNEHPITKALQIKVLPAISGIFWSVQSNVCVIQIGFQPMPDGQKQPEHPHTQVWLLKADGTVIPSSHEPSTVGISMGNHTTDSISYVFPPAAKIEACAAVISIDNKIFVDQLSKAAEVANTNALRVLVKPSKTEVRINELFQVALRVENVSATNQYVRVMNCSWYQHWKTSNSNITWVSWICTVNSAVTVEIAPGGAYTNQLTMLVPEALSQDTLSFQMGFRPSTSRTPFGVRMLCLTSLSPISSRRAVTFLMPRLL